jgi:hypothetical protein
MGKIDFPKKQKGSEPAKIPTPNHSQLAFDSFGKDAWLNHSATIRPSEIIQKLIPNKLGKASSC